MLVKVPYQMKFPHTNNAGPSSQGVYAVLQLTDGEWSSTMVTCVTVPSREGDDEVKI